MHVAPPAIRLSHSPSHRDPLEKNWPLIFKLAVAWARYIPRGKGWFARTLGRTVGKDIQTFITTRHGAKVAVCPQSLDTYSYTVTHHGCWEKDVQETLKMVLRNGECFKDIGANAGIVSLDVCAAFDGDLIVHAFEPLPYLAAALQTSVLANKFRSFAVHQSLLGNSPSEAI